MKKFYGLADAVVLSLAMCAGCDSNAVDPLPATEPKRSTEIKEAVKINRDQDAAVQKLAGHGERRMKRLLTKTGTEIKRISWDLSTSHNISQIGWPAKEQSTEYIINQEIDVSLSLPGELEFRERATMLIVRRDSPSSETVERVWILLPPVTLDAVHRTAKDYIHRWRMTRRYSMNEAMDALDKWYEACKAGGRKSFFASRAKNFPNVSLEIDQSLDDSQTFIISFAFSHFHLPLHSDVVSCFRSIYHGDTPAVLSLLRSGTAIESTDVFGNSLLHSAARHGRIDVVKYLLKEGAKVDAVGPQATTPFNRAVLRGHLKIAQLLLKNGANIHHESTPGLTVLAHVSEFETSPIPNHELAEWLVGKGARVDVRDIKKDTPLHKAAWKGHVLVAQYLVSVESDINATNSKGLTPLDHAVSQKHAKIVRLLRDNGGKLGSMP
jgi:ankyrin repeat protein